MGAETLTLVPSGLVRGEYHEPAQTSIEPDFAQGSSGRIEFFPQDVEGLADIERFWHLRLIYWLHGAADVAPSMLDSSALRVIPFPDDVPRAVFATRTPLRPNPRGVSVVRLVKRRHSELLVEDLDPLDDTPLLDLNPYVEGFDLRVGTCGGWTEWVCGGAFVQRGERRPQSK